MSLTRRKLAFFFGLNVWGLGLVLAAAPLRSPTPVAWVLPAVGLLAGTVLLSSALVPCEPRDR